jgi:hypothetical protein
MRQALKSNVVLVAEVYHLWRNVEEQIVPNQKLLPQCPPHSQLKALNQSLSLKLSNHAEALQEHLVPGGLGVHL